MDSTLESTLDVIKQDFIHVMLMSIYSKADNPPEFL